MQVLRSGGPDYFGHQHWSWASRWHAGAQMPGAGRHEAVAEHAMLDTAVVLTRMPWHADKMNAETATSTALRMNPLLNRRW